MLLEFAGGLRCDLNHSLSPPHERPNYGHSEAVNVLKYRFVG